MKNITPDERQLANLEKILQTELIIKRNVTSKIIFSKEIISMHGEPIIHPHTINVLQGQFGSHKSRFAEHICSVLLKNSENQTDLLQLKSNGKDHLVCYVDTERNISEQFPYSLQQIMINAGYQIQDEIKNFKYISLVEIDRVDRFTTFRMYLEKIREYYQGHIFCVLDVVTDLIQNFNDARDSLELTDLLNSTINSYDITFLCIIHENPNQGKARGHIGTELLNKSSTAISINYVNDRTEKVPTIVKISFQKSRTSKRMEPVYVKYSPDLNHLVYVDPLELEKVLTIKVTKAPVHEVAFYLIKNLKNRISKSELFKKLCLEFKCDSRTIEERVKELMSGDILSELGYRLNKEKIGKEVFFELEVITSENKQEDLFE